MKMGLNDCTLLMHAEGVPTFSHPFFTVTGPFVCYYRIHLCSFLFFSHRVLDKTRVIPPLLFILLIIGIGFV